MLPLSIQNKLNQIKKSSMVFDLETSSSYPDGRLIDIKRDFDNYVQNAQVKWFGAFSLKYNKSYYLNAITQRKQIETLLSEHDVLIGFNNTDFDFPILQNNFFVNPQKRYLQVDLYEILGTSNAKNRKGFKLKNKAELMKIKLKNNSLRHMAEAFGLETQKGEIDYSIFYKDEWTEEEINEIIKYLSADINAEKELFEKVWIYWLPFAELLDEKFVYDLSWLRNSIASITYKAACRVIGEEPTYAEKGSSTEEMGGNVLLPKLEEAKDVWYLDFTSLYPHVFSMFNLFAEEKNNELDNQQNLWHGNGLFQTKGYYDISAWHPLSKYVAEKLEERIYLQQTDETHPMVYTLKILLNGLYGTSRSAIFEKIHTPNCGWDCCWLGQQIQAFTIDMLDQFGFETIYGDTDSCMVIAKEKQFNNKEYLQNCLKQIIDIISDNVPFPIKTFNIKIEYKLDYIMWPFSDQPLVDDEIREQLKDGLVKGYIEKEIDKKKCIVNEETGEVVKIGRSWVKQKKSKKKNYLYVYEDKGETKVEIVGLPIKKDNASPLSMQIFKEVLEPLIIKNKRAKFPKTFINQTLESYLQRKDVLESLAVEYKVQKLETYKEYQKCKDKSTYKPKQIQAQISKEYFNGEAGVIKLLKNNKVGKVGLGTKYCTILEAEEAKLTAQDIDITKTLNELEPFMLFEEYIKEMNDSVIRVRNVETGIKTDVSKDEFEVLESINEINIASFPKTKNILYPFKWPGNKKALLPILQEVFKQSKCTKIHEAFAGSAVFSLNTNAQSYTICDINNHVVELWKHIKNNNKQLIEIIKSYDIEKIRDNQEYYVELRAKFNSLESSIEKSALFHILLGSCTNGLARFNSKGEFNQTWGRRCVHHSLESLESLESQVQKFNILLQSYEKTNVDNETLLYLDPPYLLSNDCYTAKGWNEQNEVDFLNWLSTIKTKWCLSNIITKDTRINEFLHSFGKMYNIYYLSKKYNAKVGGYSDNLKKHQSQEVLITNFDVDFNLDKQAI